MRKKKNLNIEINHVKENQMGNIELKNTIELFKNQLLYGLNSRVVMTEVRISKLEDRTIELTQSEKQRENRLQTNKHKNPIELQGPLG